MVSGMGDAVLLLCREDEEGTIGGGQDGVVSIDESDIITSVVCLYEAVC